jgi:hypothetical protein
MCARGFALSVVFRRGFQWPFREGDTLRVYRHGDRELLAELPASFVLELVYNHLNGLALQARMADHLQPVPEPPRLPAASRRRLRGHTRTKSGGGLT